MGKGGKAIGGIIAAIILVAVIVPIVGAVIAFFAARDSFPEFDGIGPTDDTTYLPGQAPGKNGVNVHTVEGYTEMVDALRDETDATFAFSAVLYPRYAVIEVPTGTNNRYQNFYWNGEELELQDIKGTTDDGQVDLSLVDPQQMVDMLNTVRDRLDNPENWYVIIGDSFGAGPQISCLREQRLQRVQRPHPDPRRHRRLRLRGAAIALVVMGVSGSGKSTVGAALAERLGLAFLDADSLHPPSNVAKMARGEPLTDQDRWPWLAEVGAWLAGAGGVVACSALRRSYRDVLRDHCPTWWCSTSRRRRSCSRSGSLNARDTSCRRRCSTRSSRRWSRSRPDERGVTLSAALPTEELVDAYVRSKT